MRLRSVRLFSDSLLICTNHNDAMLDLAHICHRCGAQVDDPSNPRWPLCQRCTNDPAYQRTRRYRREARRCQLARVRAWRRGVSGKYHPGDVERLRRRQGNRCLYCHADLTQTGTHVEHQVPLSRGGCNDASNIVLTCPRCNRDKGAMTHEEFVAHLHSKE